MTGWVLAVGIGLTLLALRSLRVVGDAERLVVSRLGRTVRVTGPGLAGWLPIIEAATLVSLRPARVDLVVTATTADGVTVHLWGWATFRVADARRASCAVGSAQLATTDEAECRLAAAVSRLPVRQLLTHRETLESDVCRLSAEALSGWGVELAEVHVTDIEARLTSTLLQSLDGNPARAR